ncbi:MAG TPA: aldolase/citrate lyase family protein [Acidimicrobiia bacterium]|nr:aldolase/citrate lyase family protein [Acidimicrobiia bacterium]
MSDAQTLRSKDVIHGLWSVTGHHHVIDTAASVGPDFIVIDTQHGVDLGLVDASMFTVMAGYGVPGLIRVESIDLGRIGRALDLGAAGIVVPLIASPEDAKQAVRATRHGPRGGRSYGMQTRRVGPFDEEPYVVIQVETVGAVENIDAIAAVDGVDALYIGPADLGLGLGGAPAPDVDEVFDGTHPNATVLADAFRSVVTAANSAGIVPGLHCATGERSARAVEEGFRMTSVAVDLGLIGAGLRAQLETARDASS